MRNIALSLIFLLICTASASGQMDPKADLQPDSWYIQITADVPGLFPEALQYTVLDHNPIPLFSEILDTIEASGSEIDPSKMDPMDAFIYWDLVFQNVSGDQLDLVPTSPHEATLFGMSSNAEEGHKWVIVKSVLLKEQALCWIVPVVVKKGSSINISFTLKNAINIKDLCKEILEKR